MSALMSCILLLHPDRHRSMRLLAGTPPSVSVSMHLRTDPRASVPRCSFATLGIFAPLCLPLEFLGLSEPMESQVMAWPHLYAGEDVVLVSEAGSGKTMAYLLPLIQRVWEAEERGDKKSGQVAVVVPTQDLAVQVLKQARQLCDGGPLTCGDAAGDARGSHVLVGTPSTMVQCLGRSFRDRPGELTLVLDEADMLLSGVKKTATSSDRPVRPSHLNAAC